MYTTSFSSLYCSSNNYVCIATTLILIMTIAIYMLLIRISWCSFAEVSQIRPPPRMVGSCRRWREERAGDGVIYR